MIKKNVRVGYQRRSGISRDEGKSPRPFAGRGTYQGFVNRDNTLANWVSGMATEGGQRRETLAGWGDDTI
jgi:hypothetical protein